MLKTLTDVLPAANARGGALIGFVCLGWEDARAYVEAGEAVGAPVILQVGPGARSHMPLTAWGPMLRHLGENASVPVVVHLDHAIDAETCRAAIDAGFTSVMIDGSRLPFEENVALTRAACEIAHGAGISCEGEIGFVGYHHGDVSNPTDPDEAGRFAQETEVDALAVSVGNVHLQKEAATRIDRAALTAIETVVPVPLVLHGASGLAREDRVWAARESRVAKFNLGTELRRTFGNAIRDVLADDAALFDRNAILSRAATPLRDAAERAVREVRA